MKQRNRSLAVAVAASAAILLAAAPCAAGIHYQATTRTEGATERQSANVQVEGWVAGEKAKVEFKESGGNPITQKGSYILTKDGAKTLYLVNPEEKTYAEMDLSGLLGAAGAVMNGMGPLLKIQFSEPKVEKLLDEEGGALLGIPTRHYKFRTSYSTTVKVLGMGSSSDVVTEQEVWSTAKLSDLGLGVWLRAEPPRTGNAEFDKLINAEAFKIQGFPLKMITVTTSTDKKKGKSTTTRSTMEVTQLDASASIPAGAFEIPAGYEETQLMPMRPGG